MNKPFLTKTLNEISRAASTSGRKIKAFFENERSPIPQLYIFEEHVGNGPILMCMVSDGGFIPIMSYSDRLPVEVQRPFGIRKIRPLIMALPRQNDDEFKALESSDVVQCLKDFWRRHQRL